MQAIQTALHLKIIMNEWSPEQTIISSSEPPFTWNMDLSESKQSEEYMKHLNKVISLPSNLKWYDSKKNMKFLTVLGQSWLPFDLKDTTDVAILDKDYSKCLGQEATGIGVFIELKKVG